MRDVSEWATVYECWVVFQCLYNVWLHRIFQQNGHCAVCFDVACEYRCTVTAIGYDHVTQTGLQIFEVFRQAQDRHNFGRHCDVKTCLTWETVRNATQGCCDLTQRAVVHVHNATPHNATCVDLKGVAPVDVVVDHSRKQ